jgi:hypothetical protein
MKPAGILLIVLGLAGLIRGGFSFTTKEKVIDLGPVEVSKEERRNVPITPLASGAVLIAGIALLVVGSKKKS